MTGSPESSSSLKVLMGYQFDTLTDIIGKGAYGTVYRAKLVDSRKCVKPEVGDLVALKKTLCWKKEEGIPASTLREVMVLRELSKTLNDKTTANTTGAENVVQLYDVIMDQGIVYIVSELCDGGDLSKYLSTLPRRRLSDSRQYRQWMLDFLCGLCFLHEKGISHRDLKPQNLVLKTDATAGRAPPYTLKLVDFGLSRLEGIPVKKYQHEVITLWYRSPDVLLGNTNYSFTADMWSAGCIMAETASGNPLFHGKTNAEQLASIFARLGPPTAHNFPSMRLYALHDQYAASFSPAPAAKDRDRERDQRDNRDNRDHKDNRENRERDKHGKASGGPADARHCLRHYFQRYGALKCVGSAGVDLLARLLAYEPARRLTVREALQHPFFAVLTAPVAAKPRPRGESAGRKAAAAAATSNNNSSKDNNNNNNTVTTTTTTTTVATSAANAKTTAATLTAKTTATTTATATTATTNAHHRVKKGSG